MYFIQSLFNIVIKKCDRKKKKVNQGNIQDREQQSLNFIFSVMQKIKIISGDFYNDIKVYNNIYRILILKLKFFEYF